MVLLAFVAGAAIGVAVATADSQLDKGRDRPPASVPAPDGTLGLTSDRKAIWMTEWSACWNVSMAHLSKVLRIPIRPGVTPQQAANRLATRAVWLLYETTPETLAAKDGCRNGILWRYYHPS
jgi:hypothetical protein